MENIKSKRDGIDILAEITRRDMERSLQIQDVKDVNAHWTPRHGWHLKNKKDSSLLQTNTWQDDYK